jgi:hypothetical protein
VVVDPDKSRLAKLDLAIIVYYRVWPFWFIQKRSLFYFSARPTDDFNGTIFDRQPATQIEKEIDRFEATHPRSEWDPPQQ